jgi:RNA polymerase sigma factor (TIGR02999 family)
VTLADRTDAVLELLARASEGDSAALDQLIPLVHDELRAIAHDQRSRWRGDETLGTTALVNEAYLRLVAQERPDWKGRAHFLAVAGQAMRHVLIDYARRRKASKRGGSWDRVTIDRISEVLPGGALAHDRVELLIQLEGCLKRLEEESERHARIVECRFFGGMTIQETADALGLSPRTVKRGWALAQAWLHREMDGSQPTA